jgi:hypothetical protein
MSPEWTKHASRESLKGCVFGDRAPLPAEQLFKYRRALYGCVALRLDDYVFHARPISLAWDTVAMPTAACRQLAMPIDWLFSPPSGDVAEGQLLRA